MPSPVPSLPVFGTDRPPVATITASATSASSPAIPTDQRSPSRDSDVTIVSKRSCTPLRRASDSSPSRTSRALCDAGKSFADSTSSSSRMPTSCSKNATCAASGQLRTILRNVFGEESVTKRDSSTREPGQHVAPPPAADEDLAPTISGALEQHRLGAAARGEDRRHGAGRAGPEDDDGRLSPHE
jgi:hypothetical protein